MLTPIRAPTIAGNSRKVDMFKLSGPLDHGSDNDKDRDQNGGQPIGIDPSGYSGPKDIGRVIGPAPPPEIMPAKNVL